MFARKGYLKNNNSKMISDLEYIMQLSVIDLDNKTMTSFPMIKSY